ncbi:molybdopterin biosynthesis protein MoeB [Proteiniborus sp. DW1]|uniref:HesA/MoeB/ThiF family protein n=1 Tax=Proteiniborus sp. DW1 TaxID=1889883 RepID=UPI00092E0DD5|nr:HesA/MoeB/ThiF family protein [Proteiniborus sp. DW1]SCG82487.1 molybdopterin biosynthesis protein MoeB [Proteiniborus sp. DW1]
MKRYSRNMNMLSPEENASLSKFKVCIIGCGGLGGYIIEMLARLGIGHLTVVDGDVFEESNLNRQLLSDMDSLGKSKALIAKDRINKVNPLINVKAVSERLTEDNGLEILAGHDVIVDALDNIDTRLLIQKQAEELRIPLVHGAIAGWYGQVSTIFPGDRTLDLLYSNSGSKGLEEELGNPSFTPALVASIEVSEVLKILINRGDLLRRKLLIINTLNQDYEVINL